MSTVEAKSKATMEYVKSHYDQIIVKVSKGVRNRINEHAKALGKSKNEYICDLIYADMDGYEPPKYEQTLLPYMKVIRKLFRRETYWEDPIGNTLARCLKDGEITEDECRAIIMASGVDRNKFDARMRAAGIRLPETHHLIQR